jgi:hypothetical protein
MTASERDRIRKNAEALSELLQLSNHLRRENVSKLHFALADWSAAVQRVLASPEARPSDSDSTIEEIRRAHKVARRLGNSGEARFGSYGVGREPRSSIDGRRFFEDIEMAEARLRALAALLQPVVTEPPAGADGENAATQP